MCKRLSAETVNIHIIQCNLKRPSNPHCVSTSLYWQTLHIDGTRLRRTQNEYTYMYNKRIAIGTSEQWSALSQLSELWIWIKLSSLPTCGHEHSVQETDVSTNNVLSMRDINNKEIRDNIMLTSMIHLNDNHKISNACCLTHTHHNLMCAQYANCPSLSVRCDNQ